MSEHLDSENDALEISSDIDIETSLHPSQSISQISTITDKINKRRRLTPKVKSWVYTHLNEQRACNNCGFTFKPSTSTGTIASHLNSHSIYKESDPVANGPKQKQINDCVVSARKALIYDSAYAELVVTSQLGHNSISSSSMKRFAGKTTPGYKLKSARTIKRRILCMYVVLRSQLVNLLNSFQHKVAITFDGWSNENMKGMLVSDIGFYSVTLHFISVTTMQLHECILDFFHVTPGNDVSTRVGQYLFEMLEAYGLGKRVIASVNDNGSDAISAAKKLGKKLVSKHSDPSLLPESHQLRCFTHTIQLGIKAALKPIEMEIEDIRKVNLFN